MADSGQGGRLELGNVPDTCFNRMDIIAAMVSRLCYDVMNKTQIRDPRSGAFQKAGAPVIDRSDKYYGMISSTVLTLVVIPVIDALVKGYSIPNTRQATESL